MSFVCLVEKSIGDKENMKTTALSYPSFLISLIDDRGSDTEALGRIPNSSQMS